MIYWKVPDTPCNPKSELLGRRGLGSCSLTRHWKKTKSKKETTLCQSGHSSTNWRKHKTGICYKLLPKEVDGVHKSIHMMDLFKTACGENWLCRVKADIKWIPKANACLSRCRRRWRRQSVSVEWGEPQMNPLIVTWSLSFECWVSIRCLCVVPLTASISEHRLASADKAKCHEDLGGLSCNCDWGAATSLTPPWLPQYVDL